MVLIKTSHARLARAIDPFIMCLLLHWSFYYTFSYGLSCIEKKKLLKASLPYEKAIAPALGFPPPPHRIPPDSSPGSPRRPTPFRCSRHRSTLPTFNSLEKNPAVGSLENATPPGAAMERRRTPWFCATPSRWLASPPLRLPNLPWPRHVMDKDTITFPWHLRFHSPGVLLAGSTPMSSPIQCGSQPAIEMMLAGSHADPPRG